MFQILVINEKITNFKKKTPKLKCTTHSCHTKLSKSDEIIKLLNLGEVVVVQL